MEDKLEEIQSNTSVLKFYKSFEGDYNRKWKSILEEDNIASLSVEMTRTLINVSCFITRTESEYKRISSETFGKEQEKKLKEQLVVGRELLTKLKVLSTLEKSTALEKYDQPNVRKLSICATEETGSVIDTESVIAGTGHGGFSREPSIDRKDSRVITLSHHYAASFTRRYDDLNKRTNHHVEQMIDRFNKLLDNIGAFLQMKSNVIHNSDNYFSSEHLPPDLWTASAQKQKDDREGDNSISNSVVTIEINQGSRSMVDILMEHLQQTTSVKATFRHVNVSGSGHLVEHTYSCSLLGIYTEGKARKKLKAKENSAMEMLKQLIKKQKAKTLPSQLLPFSDLQLHELNHLLDENEDLIEKLEEICLQAHEQPPLYSVLSEVGKNNEPHFVIKCESMGLTAVGNANRKIQAKKNAAKSILNLVTKRRKSQVSFQ